MIKSLVGMFLVALLTAALAAPAAAQEASPQTPKTGTADPALAGEGRKGEAQQPAQSPSATSQAGGATGIGTGSAAAPPAPGTQAEERKRVSSPAAQAMAPARPAQPAASARLEREPWERAALNHLFSVTPERVNVAILTPRGKRKAGEAIAFILVNFRRRRLEQRIGKRIVVVNRSNLNRPPGPRSVIAYRAGFLRAALLMAETIPGEQEVVRMGIGHNRKIGIDVEITVGRELP